MTVSYTHLDVYKRQYEGNVQLIQELNLKTNRLQEDVLSINEQLNLSLIHISFVPAKFI